MDRSSAIRQLPALHAVAVRLRDDGLGDHVVAVALEIDDDQVPALLQIADSKLQNLLAPALVASARTDGPDRPRTTHANTSRDEGASS